MPCSFSDVTWTGRAALLISGHMRTAAEHAPTLHTLVQENAPETQLDIFYHVWADPSSECDRQALDAMRQVATAITIEPTNCSWLWCNDRDSFGCQWHLVDRGYQAFASLADPSKYSIVVKMRSDMGYNADLWNNAVHAASKPQPKLSGALVHLWARYVEGNTLARARGNNFLLLGDGFHGWDMMAIGTPDVIRAYSTYSEEEGWGCDSKMDNFPWKRALRYGVWLDANESSAARDAERRNPVMPWAHVEAEPRCAPLHTADFPFQMTRGRASSPSDRTYCSFQRARRTTSASDRHRDRGAVYSWSASRRPRSSENNATSSMEERGADRVAGQGRQLMSPPPEVQLMSQAERTEMEGYCALHQRDMYYSTSLQ